MNFYDEARKRVENTPTLTAHRETLMYGWSGDDSHWAWLATVPVAEIVDWASMVESMERELESMDEPEPQIDIAQHNIVHAQMMASILGK